MKSDDFVVECAFKTWEKKTQTPGEIFSYSYIYPENDYYYRIVGESNGFYFSRFPKHGRDFEVFHRTDGPAIIRSNGQQEYWLDGEPYAKEKFEAIDSWVLNRHY